MEVAMPADLPNGQDLGFYFALAQVGLEMVAPLGVGVLVDQYFGSHPWATIVGFAFGFIGGFIHLLVLVNRHNGTPKKKGGTP
jgi:F0F1-type ATP synthase assembly protein I